MMNCGKGQYFEINQLSGYGCDFSVITLPLANYRNMPISVFVESNRPDAVVIEHNQPVARLDVCGPNVTNIDTILLVDKLYSPPGDMDKWISSVNPVLLVAGEDNKYNVA